MKKGIRKTILGVLMALMLAASSAFVVVADNQSPEPGQYIPIKPLHPFTPDDVNPE
ncbi:MAG: hypothetical protein LBE35_11500 [Clostridiales bacterium]|nr:hypothetical protein [Clostridiales bacterium]